MITVVLGGQYGSEGKGSVVSWLARLHKYDLVIRTGSPNAGHTFLSPSGELIKLRQLPCTMLFQNTDVYIPAGAVINLDVLKDESARMRASGYKGTVHVSRFAAVIDEHEAREQEKLITSGTTGEGVGATRAAKCLRQAKLIKDFWAHDRSSAWSVQHILGDPNKNILIEATQGFGLSMDGDAYPNVTSTNLDTYRVLSDAEVPFGVHQIEPWVVLRTFPIRIAGNSGFLFNETSWPALRAKYGNHIPDEQTTVTKKTRRVGEFDSTLSANACRRCGSAKIVLTFVDYVFPKIRETGVTDEVNHWLLHLEGMLSHPVDYLGIGIGELIPRFYMSKEDKAYMDRVQKNPSNCHIDSSMPD
jgi:adenylosuccinate synthase